MITIPGELCDLNTYIKAERTNKFISAKIKSNETARVYYSAKLSGVKKIDKPVKILMKWYTINLRKDPDNTSFAKKFTNDGLVLAGIIPNDTREWITGFCDEFYVDKDNPRVEIIFQ